MAESRTATFNRYLRGDFTPAEAKGIIAFLVFDKVMDIATFGSINRLTGKALTATTKQVLTKVLPFAARGAATVGGSVGMSAARAALPIVTQPYGAGTAVGYGALPTQSLYHNRRGRPPPSGGSPWCGDALEKTQNVAAHRPRYHI